MVCPPTYNFLSNNGFRIVIERLPGVVFFAQNVNLPGVRVTQANQATPFQLTPIFGLQPEYESFTVRFKVDERMDNYFAVHQWIQELSTPQSFDQSTGEVFHSQIKVFVLDSNGDAHNEITLHNGFPVALSGVDFTTENINPIWVEGTMTIAYTHYTRRVLGGN